MFTQNELIAETGKLQKFSMKLARNKANADDLFQSTCLRALEKSDQFKGGTNLFSWTSRIMYNLFVSDYRRKVKFETQYDPEPVLQRTLIAASQEIHVEFHQVKRMIAKLNPEHREILTLVCAQGLSYKETSEKLQIPLGTVRSRLSRARAQLQAIIDAPVLRMTVPAIVPERPVNENILAIPAYIAARTMQKT